MNRKLMGIGLLVLVSAPLFAQQNDVVTRAMKDEMQRTMKDLRLDSTDGPYYIAYKIVDRDRKETVASLGALVSSEEARSRVLTVTVHVGSYDLDNTNFNGGGRGGGGAGQADSLSAGSNIRPIDDSYDELRRKIWLATDAAYKRAVEELSAKKAAQQNSNREEAIPDFSKQPERQESEVLPPIDEDTAGAEHLVRVASAVFHTLPSIQSSEAVLDIENATEHFLNSEGTAYTRQVPEIFFHASASLQHDSGEILSDSYSAYGHSFSDLPSEAVVLQNTGAVVERLSARLQGTLATRYIGPVLVEGESAAELFAHNFADQLAARGRSGAGGPGGRGGGGRGGGFAGNTGGVNASFLNKIGSRVFPDFMTVVDNPQLTQIDGHPLFGSYKFDEEGVPSRETVIVKDGILKTLLTSRAPARGIPQSTGNMRERGVLPGNLIVTSSKSASIDDLKKQLLDLVKTRDLEYGMIVRRLSGDNAIEAVRVYPDGHEETVRDSRIEEFVISSFKDVLAVSTARTVYTESAQGVFNFGGDFISYAVPDMLFEEMTLEHIPNDNPKLPDIPNPLASN